MTYYIATFYKFSPISSQRVEEIKAELEELARIFQIEGLTVLGTEGLNCTVSALSQESLLSYIRGVQGISEIGDFWHKPSQSDRKPFRKFKVDIRPEIVTLGTPHLVPKETHHHHLPPEEWEKALNEPGVVVIDTRNRYELKVGKFKNAVDPRIDEFTSFPEAVKSMKLEPDQKILIYCTGGIRCEKAILGLEEIGFNNVWQLEGGILNYLKHFPNKSWEGECFVFDHRVAVDQNLQPSKRYHFCPHCGQASDLTINCIRCDEPCHPCSDCMEIGDYKKTCSKNCAHHYQVRPGKGRRQILDLETRKSLKNPFPRKSKKKEKTQTVDPARRFV